MNAQQAKKLTIDSEQLADEVNYLQVMAEIEAASRANDFTLYTSIPVRPTTEDKLKDEGYEIGRHGGVVAISWANATPDDVEVPEVEKVAEIDENKARPAEKKRSHKKKPTKAKK